MNKKSTGLLLSILGVLSLVLITAGVTYAFFSYTKEGETDNTIQTGTITFYYDELEASGAYIDIEDALPMTDEEGKTQLTATNEYFDFKVTSTVTGEANIDYEVTVKKQDGSTLPDNRVKVYLTAEGSDTTGTNHTLDGDAVKLFSNLPEPTTAVADKTIEKLVYNGQVPGGTSDYTENFQLRMWIDGETAGNTATDYSPYEFVLKTAATGTTALKADELITAGTLITSKTYYALGADERANYERIAYVNQTARTIWTVSQAAADGFAAGDGFVAGEQFYSLNDQKFTLRVNVYANATVVQ